MKKIPYWKASASQHDKLNKAQMQRLHHSASADQQASVSVPQVRPPPDSYHLALRQDLSLCLARLPVSENVEKQRLHFNKK